MWCLGFRHLGMHICFHVRCLLVEFNNRQIGCLLCRQLPLCLNAKRWCSSPLWYYLLRIPQVRSQWTRVTISRSAITLQIRRSGPRLVIIRKLGYELQYRPRWLFVKQSRGRLESLNFWDFPWIRFFAESWIKTHLSWCRWRLSRKRLAFYWGNLVISVTRSCYHVVLPEQSA